MNFAALPKVELHLHLEGAAPPDFIRELGAEQGLELGGVFDAAGGYQWRDFAEFLQCYAAACEALKTPKHFKRLMTAVLQAQADQGVIYTELFIAPDICGGDAVAWAEYLAAMEEGADSVPGVEARFISTCIRNLGPQAARNAADVTLKCPSKRLTGFGMGGEERDFTAQDFAPAFQMARDGGLMLTSHAGEVCGPESVIQTLDQLNVTRVGHGVRSIEDPALVARLADDNICLEVCPGSNIALSVFPDWLDHPIHALREAGVPVTVSTDDPPYFHTDLNREYAMLHRHFGWGPDDFLAQNRTALSHAFCDAPTRDRLLKTLEARHDAASYDC